MPMARGPTVGRISDHREQPIGRHLVLNSIYRYTRPPGHSTKGWRADSSPPHPASAGHGVVGPVEKVRDTMRTNATRTWRTFLLALAFPFLLPIGAQAAPGAFDLTSPANGAWCTATCEFTWQAASSAVSYDLYVDGAVKKAPSPGPRTRSRRARRSLTGGARGQCWPETAATRRRPPRPPTASVWTRIRPQPLL
jgi:hypothetical protein